MPLRSHTGTNQQDKGMKQERRIQALQFGLLSPDVVVKMSVAEIKSTVVYDQTTFVPNFHAINDPRMGVMEKQNLCYTCK
jgi:DNA-directed RNA polymerase II subunit RPB1